MIEEELVDWQEMIEWRSDYQWSDAERHIHERITDILSAARSMGAMEEEERPHQKPTYEKFEGPEGTASIPTNAEAWELYSSMVGVEGPAQQMTNALKKAIKAENRAEAIKIMRAAMEKYANWGAADTEPRGIAERCLTDARGGDYGWAL